MDHYTLDAQSVRRIARAVQRTERELVPPGIPQADDAGRSRQHWVAAKNDGTDPIVSRGLVVVTDSTAAANRLRVKVKVPPSGPSNFSRLIGVNGPQAIQPGKWGWVTLTSGLVLVRYEVSGPTPAIGEGWGVKPGTDRAAKGYPGLTIVGLHDEANRVAVAVLQTPLSWLLGKSTGSISAGASTSSYNIYAGATKGSESSTWSGPSAWARSAIANAKWCGITFVNGGWEIGPLEC